MLRYVVATRARRLGHGAHEAVAVAAAEDREAVIAFLTAARPYVAATANASSAAAGV